MLLAAVAWDRSAVVAVDGDSVYQVLETDLWNL